MEIYYLINGKKYLDTHLLRQKLDLTKWELQVVMNTYQFPESEIVNIQNRKLYSVRVLEDLVKKLLIANEG